MAEMEYTITIGAGDNGALRVTVGRPGYPLATDLQTNDIAGIPERIARMLLLFGPGSSKEDAALEVVVRKLRGE